MKNIKFKKYFSFIFTIIFLFSFSTVFIFSCFAQEIKDEKQEEQIKKVTEETTLLEKQEAEKALKARWNSNIVTSYGFETNPKLSTIRKGDHFETFRYTLNFRKTVAERNQFGINLDVKHQNYGEITDLTNTLGHTRFDYKLAVSKNYILGSGFDLALSNFLNDENASTYYPKIFVNFQHRPSNNFYHQLQYEFGWKMYDEALALLSSTTTYQDNKRKDLRETLEYSLGYTLSERLSTNFRLAGSFNNSNSFFQDYYDYHSYQVAPRIFYKINDQLSINTSYTYEYKPYSSRNVNGGSYEQLDRISNVKAGFLYKLNKHNSFTFDYSYMQNASNDSQSDYIGNAVEGSWRYIF